MTREPARRRGLTIAELLVVVALIIILAMLLVVGGGYAHSSAVQLQCQHHLEQIGHACSVYVTGHQGQWPRSYDPASMRQWYWTLAPKYIADTTVLNCPATSAQLGEPRPELAALTRQDKIELAVLKALRWLKSKQLSTGRWPTTGIYSGSDLAPSMTAIDAFLRFGCTTEEPVEFAQTVDLGLGALMRWACDWDEVNRREGRTFILGTGLSALAHGYMHMGDKRYVVKGNTYGLHQAATLPFQMVALDQHPLHGGFDYSGPGSTNSSNMCSGGWLLYGIAEAKKAGMTIPPSVLPLLDTYLEVAITANQHACSATDCRRCTSGRGVCDVCRNTKSSGSVNRSCAKSSCSGKYRPCVWKGTSSDLVRVCSYCQRSHNYDYSWGRNVVNGVCQDCGRSDTFIGLTLCPICNIGKIVDGVCRHWECMKSGSIYLGCPNCSAVISQTWSGDGAELAGGNCPACGGTVTKAQDDYRTPEYPAPLSTTQKYEYDWPRWMSMCLAARLTVGHQPNSSAPDYSKGKNAWNQLSRFWDAIYVDQKGKGENEFWDDIWTIYYTTIVMRTMGDGFAGKNWWSDWQNRYVDLLLNAQREDGRWTPNMYRGVASDTGPLGGDVMATALACLALMLSLEGWEDVQELSADGACTYGYNNQVGMDRRTVASDTVILMDYENWEIDRNKQGVDDPPDFVAPRHGGRANVLFADGRVESLAPEGIRDGMFTVQQD